MDNINNIGNRAINEQRLSGYYPTTNQGLINKPYMTQGTWYRSSAPDKSSDIHVRHNYNPYFRPRSGQATYDVMETSGNDERYFSMRGSDLNNYMAKKKYSTPNNV